MEIYMMEQENMMLGIRELTDKELDCVSGGFAMSWASRWSGLVTGIAAGAIYGAAGGPGGAVVGGLFGASVGFAFGGITSIGYGLGSNSLSSRFRRRVRED
jgi:bacteriocin-like protein